MYILDFKSLFRKVAIATALCTSLVVIRWYYIEPVKYRVYEIFEFLANHKSSVVLTLLFLIALHCQRWLYNTRSSPLEWDSENLRQCNEKEKTTNYLGGQSTWETAEFDTLLDYMLREASRYIIGSQSLSDVDKKIPIPMPMGFDTRPCHFTATGGRAQYLNSLSRRRKTTLHLQEDGGLLLSAGIGLHPVVVRYSHYAAYMDMGILPPVYASGELNAVTAPLTLRVEMALRAPFRAELLSARVESAGPLQATVTGLGEWGFMWPDIQKAALPSLQTELVQLAELRATALLQDALARLARWVADIPRVRLVPEASESPKVSGALAMEPPALTLTPSNIALGGGLTIGGIFLLGQCLAGAFGGSSRSDDKDK